MDRTHAPPRPSALSRRLDLLKLGALATTSLSVAQGFAATCFDNNEFSVHTTNPAGIGEPAVAVLCNGIALGPARAVEINSRVPGTTSYPLTYVDIVANAFARGAPQRANGTSQLSLSTIGSYSLRPTDGTLRLVPSVDSVAIDASTNAGYHSTFTGHMDDGSGNLIAEIASQRSLSPPEIGRTSVRFDQSFFASRDIDLATGAHFSYNDRLRIFTLSSMFASPTQYDTNVIQWLDRNGQLQTLALNAQTPRDAHLFATPIETAEVWLLKTPGSTWLPDSPNLHVKVVAGDGKRLGLQGFLAATTNPNDDSLSLYFEWLDAPDRIPIGTSLQHSITADFTSAVPAPAAVYLLGSGLLALRLRAGPRLVPARAIPRD